MSYNPYQPTCLVATGVAVPLSGTTTKTALLTYNMQAGLMGLRDMLEIYAIWSYTNSGNAKTMTFTGGATNIANFASTTTAGIGHISWWSNRGAANSQITNPITTGSSLGNIGAPGTTALDTSAILVITINGQLSAGAVAAGDSMQLEMAHIRLWRFL